jgi:uncharacterized membrane protein
LKKKQQQARNDVMHGNIIGSLAGILPFLIISFVVIGAVLYALFIFLAPLAAIVAAVLLPLFPILLFGAPLKSAIPFVIYDAVIIGVLYLLKKKKEVEISKW